MLALKETMGNGDGKHYRAGNITITGNTIQECDNSLALGYQYDIPPVSPMMLAGVSNKKDRMIDLSFEESANIYDFSQV